MSFKVPILLCSTLCKYCIEFVETINSQKPALLDEIVIINIDTNPETGDRPRAYYEIQELLSWKVEKVPTIITENAKDILGGDNAFKWLETKLLKEFKQFAGDSQFSRIGEPSCSIPNPTDFNPLSKKEIAGTYDRLLQERQAEFAPQGPRRELSPPIETKR